MLADHTGSLAPLHPISYTGSMARMLPLRTNDSMTRLLSLSTADSMAPLLPDQTTTGSLARLHPILTGWLEAFFFALTSSMARMLPMRITSWLVRPTYLPAHSSNSCSGDPRSKVVAESEER